MAKFWVKIILAVAIFSIAPLVGLANAADDQGIDVFVKKVGELVIVDAAFNVPTTQRQAWNVLVDYEHMTRFVPNLRTSIVVERGDSRLRVSQTSTVPFGFLSMSVDTVRDVDLKPYSQIRSHVISGTLKKGDATTRLIDQGSSTHIVYHSETISGTWIPPGVGLRFIRTNIRDQMNALRSEMIRRQSSGS
ncbi:SRPBCC family protein [Undibacterium arcticum]|uniref:SRPBCC family protein n=1 Tax=Undibacterium arcticum TaxID=1762892 RepID=A0ABV7EZ59_9BURK